MAMNIVILAAGQGKRMKSALPKVLQPLAGKPLLEYVLEIAISLIKAAEPIVVIGHGAEHVNAFLGDLASRNPSFKAIKTVLQKEQKGTGHALLQTITKLNKDLPTLVLYGDVPLITKDTLQHLIRLADGVRSKRSAFGLLTQNMANPTGYGRIVRDQDGLVSAIVEEKDASPSIKGITEINTGIMVLPTDSLSKWLKSLKTKNAQGEYYLTDVIAMAVRDGVPIRTSQAKNEHEILGVNSRDQLAALERQLQKQRATALLETGVTLFDPERIDIRGELVCGQDVWIDIGCVFEGRVQLANGVQHKLVLMPEWGPMRVFDRVRYWRTKFILVILSKLKIQGLQHRVKRIISLMWATRSSGRASILVLAPLPVITMASISTKRLLRMMRSLGPIHS